MLDQADHVAFEVLALCGAYEATIVGHVHKALDEHAQRLVHVAVDLFERRQLARVLLATRRVRVRLALLDERQRLRSPLAQRAEIAHQFLHLFAMTNAARAQITRMNSLCFVI